MHIEYTKKRGHFGRVHSLSLFYVSVRTVHVYVLQLALSFRSVFSSKRTCLASNSEPVILHLRLIQLPPPLSLSLSLFLYDTLFRGSQLPTHSRNRIIDESQSSE